MLKQSILWFKQIRKNDLSIAGGKAANLGEMFSNFPVPDGFVVTVQAYDKFLAANNLNRKIDAIIQKLDVNNTKQLDASSQKIREMILHSDMDAKLASDIKSMLRKYASQSFAVRSSATAEDLPEASFAGQQDTYLNVSKGKVAENVKKCWASLYTSRAIFYRHQNKIKGHVGIAVVVQEMIDADYAGVCFTVDPVRKKHILVETVKGLGEKLVSGEVTPNTYFVDKKSFRIVEKHENYGMNEKLIAETARIAARIQKHYKKPMDIEFAVKKNKIHILQARPITTL